MIFELCGVKGLSNCVLGRRSMYSFVLQGCIR